MAEPGAAAERHEREHQHARLRRPRSPLRHPTMAAGHLFFGLRGCDRDLQRPGTRASSAGRSAVSSAGGLAWSEAMAPARRSTAPNPRLARPGWGRSGGWRRKKGAK
jgi:hypothetical protein